MKVFHLYITLYLFLSSVVLHAQQTEKVRAEYIYYAPENVTLEAAKRTALERAKIQAIADEFGTMVSQSNATFMTNRDGESNTGFFSLGGSEVKGEWIETIGEPAYSISYEQGMLAVKCVVNGRIREITTNQVDLKIEILRNGTEKRFESDRFKNGDDFFLNFQSPKDGYLAIYLVDGTQTAYCLLPYRSQTEGIFPVKANQPYTLFSIKHAPTAERQLVDEYVMTTAQTAEYNQVYVIYSPNPFTKAIDMRGGTLIPRTLSFEDFHKWLADCRKSDKEMQVRNSTILIEK